MITYLIQEMNHHGIWTDIPDLAFEFLEAAIDSYTALLQLPRYHAEYKSGQYGVVIRLVKRITEEVVIQAKEQS